MGLTAEMVKEETAVSEGAPTERRPAEDESVGHEGVEVQAERERAEQERAAEQGADVDQGHAQTALPVGGRAATRSGDDLEHEGDIAADYLEELLDIADLDGDLDIDVEADRAAVSVVGGGLDHLVGRDGEVLEALQELTRLAVLRETGARSRLMLDIGGYRANRRAALEKRAAEVATEVRESGQAQKLEAMTPFERKVVHDAVAVAGLNSESEGEEPQRCVVVLPA